MILKTPDWPARWRHIRTEGKMLTAQGASRPDQVAANAFTNSEQEFSHVDLVLLHPCFGLGAPHDPSGLLLSMAQPANANEAAEALHAALPLSARERPVALGICATDPFLLRDFALRKWRDAGVIGLVNLPTVAALDGLYRADLEASGMGYEREVDLMIAAKAHGFFTVALAFTPSEAEQMARAKVDALILHLGWTFGEGKAESKSEGPRGLAAHVHEWRKLEAGARKGNPDVLLLLAGDALLRGEDREALAQIQVDGVMETAKPLE